MPPHVISCFCIHNEHTQYSQYYTINFSREKARLNFSREIALTGTFPTKEHATAVERVTAMDWTQALHRSGLCYEGFVAEDELDTLLERHK